ncbi:MAG TPA: peptidylprolyl isomerase [Myxococcaceae bacterium]|nr:peptidylprolyl isomerase [Myxococcaceae bacterium]
MALSLWSNEQEVRTDRPVELPRVAAPSLEKLSVTVPAPEGVTAEDVLARFAELAREHAERRDRQPGEAVALGDEVKVDTLGYSGGRLIPFSARAGAWLRVLPDPSLPTFYEALVGQPVGTSTVIHLRLPDDYPVEALRGQPARFIVDVVAAREVRLPELDGPGLLAALGRGTTVEETLRVLTAELLTERTEALTSRAEDLVLDALVARTAVQLPESLVDEELRRQWEAHEGALLRRKNFSDEELEESLNGWREDAKTRADVVRRLTVSLALRAIVERDGLKLTQDWVLALLQQTAEFGGVPLEEVADALRKDPRAALEVERQAWHLLAVQHVLDKAELRFEGA